jgi:polyhydroxybutyrate depolymerase
MNRRPSRRPATLVAPAATGIALLAVSACGGAGDGGRGDGGPGGGAVDAALLDGAARDGAGPIDAGVEDDAAPRDAAAGEDLGAGDLGASDLGAPPGCTPSLAPGDHVRELVHGGRTRSYRLHVPPGHDGSARVPLVLNFHGFTQTAAQQEAVTGFSALADAEGFVVAHPSGVGNSWNGGACCGTAESSGVDDVGFARAVVADVAARVCVDPARVYATGFSNGGFLAHRLGCEASDLFAAVAPVAGLMTLAPERCTGERLAALQHVHGSGDLIVPYGGNPVLRYPSVADSTATWRGVLGCVGASVAERPAPNVSCETWASCTRGGPLVLCTVERGPHDWNAAGAGWPTTRRVWDFLRTHAR